LLPALVGSRPLHKGGILSNGNSMQDPSCIEDMVFLSPALFPRRTVYSRIAYGLGLQGIVKDEIQM
jgi:ABC-type taurine transport system ATPase subunit